MGLCQTKKLLKSNRNHHQDEKANYWMKEDICKSYIQWGVNIQNIQKNSNNWTAKNKPDFKMGRRSEQVFFQKDIDMVNRHLKRCSASLIIQFSSVAQSCLTLCDPMNRSTPGLPVHHQLPEFTQTHIHQVSDAIQPSHPLSYPSPPAPNPSQHQSLFQWVNSLHEVAKVLEFRL